MHHETGGPGIDFNWVILTAALHGDFGANHANLVHRYLVEGPLLWAYLNMHSDSPTISEIYYSVIADYNRPPRQETQELEQITVAYKKAVSRARAKAVVDGGSGGAEPTHQLVMRELALEPSSPHLSDAMLAVEAKPGENWRKVHQRIEANQRLWKFEDTNVPLALQIKYSWVENGVVKGPWQKTVCITLPSSLAARFKA